ncbi:hypothetical protein DVH05_012776 [Phytophthora capsici]|nr:hypothetical protein DVH05_012776 [Phytophthora capsici]
MPIGRPKIVKPAPMPVALRHRIETGDARPRAGVGVRHADQLEEAVHTVQTYGHARRKDGVPACGVRISGAGHLKQYFIDLNIDSPQLAQYYCKHNIIMVIDQQNLEKVIQKIDNSYNSVHFIAKMDLYMKELYIVLNDEDQGVKGYHTIPCWTRPPRPTIT